MGNKKKHAVVSTHVPFQGPRAPMTDQERQWIRDVINEKKVVKRPIEKPIVIPKGYSSYWGSSIERAAKRLNRQHEFLAARFKGLAEAISRYSERGQIPPKELLDAHKNYLEAQHRTLQYALSTIDITSQEAIDNA